MLKKKLQNSFGNFNIFIALLGIFDKAAHLFKSYEISIYLIESESILFLVSPFWHFLHLFDIRGEELLCTI